VTLNPGIYYVTGGVSFTGAATVKGSGVMFYFPSGAGSINTDGSGSGGVVSNIQLSAPATGPYAGILIFQDHGDVNGARIGGDNSSFFDGALYFPGAQLTFFGSAGGSGFNVAIADAQSIVLSVNVTLNLLGGAGLPTGVNLTRNATIVE